MTDRTPRFRRLTPLLWIGLAGFATLLNAVGLFDTPLGFVVLCGSALAVGLVALLADGYEDEVKVKLPKTPQELLRFEGELSAWALIVVGTMGLLFSVAQLLL